MTEESQPDTDFFALLQEIESVDAPDTTIDDYCGAPSDLFPLFTTAIASDRHAVPDAATNCNALTKTVRSHAERCRNNRKRKKQELEELREAAVALEKTLVQFTQQQPSGCSASSWRDISRSTLLDRQRAVKENKKLREALEQHLNATHQIQQAIQSVPDLQPLCHLLHNGDSAPMSTPMFKRPRETSLAALTIQPPPSRDLYRQLFQNIHLAYKQGKHEQDMAWLKVGTRKVSMEMVTQIDSSTMCIQVMECQRLRFSLSYISDATWRHLAVPCLPSDDEDTDSSKRAVLTRDGDDVFGECDTDCNPLPAPDVMPSGRFAIRRYVEPNRLTFIWECDGCYHCDGSKKPIGSVIERGWCTIEPSKGSPASTVIRIQVQYVPKTSGQASGTRCSSPVNLSSKVALNLYQNSIARIFGAVEDEILKQNNGNKCSTEFCQ